MLFSELLASFLLGLLNLGYAEYAENAERSQVQNIVLNREKYSWCQVTPIQQIITSSGYESVTIDNNICLGACYSYSIPKTQPADPGEIIVPYCDSCQPNITKCYHVNLHADGTNISGPKAIQKRVEIIESCHCKTCEKNPQVGCDITDENTAELPAEQFTNLNAKKTQNTSEIPELLNFKPALKNLYFNVKINTGTERPFDLNTKLMKLLKTIQNEPSIAIFKYDKDEIRDLLKVIEGSDKTLDDRNLLDFVNFVNVHSVDDFELDVNKLKEVLVDYLQNKNLIEKHKNWWLDFSDNSKIKDDMRKLLKKHQTTNMYGIESGELMTNNLYKGQHIGMGVMPAEEASLPAAIETTTTEETNSITVSHKHHHHLMEEQHIGLNTGHLIKGPHGSMILTPDIKIEEKFNVETDALKPIHAGVVISYAGKNQEKPILLDE